MNTLTFKKRVIRKKGIEEVVFLNYSVARSQDALLQLWHVGRTKLSPGGEYTYKMHRSSQTSKKKTGQFLLEFACSETKCLIEFEKGKKVPAKPFAVIFKKGQTWDCKFRNDTGKDVFRYYLAMEGCGEMEQFFHLGEEEIIYCPEEERPGKLMEEIFHMAENAACYTPLDLSLKLFEFLSVLFATPREIPLGRRRESALIAHVSKFPQNYPTIESLMELFQVSKMTLHSLFRKETGKSPMEFVIRSRLYNSCWQLIWTGTPVGEIARLNGYRSTPFYSRAFKKEFGISPALYRQNALIAPPAENGKPSGGKKI